MELKDVFEYMGFEKEPENIDEFKEVVKNNWTLKKQAIEDDSVRKAVLGSSFKAVGQNIRKKLNEGYGLEIPNSELESKQIEEFVFDNIEKIKSTYESKIKEIETQITAPNEALKEYETKALKLERLLKEEKEASKAKDLKIQEVESHWSNKFKQSQIDGLKKDIFSKIKFSSDVTDVAKIGYNTLIESKYSIDFDESGEPIVVDKKKGERIPNEKVAGKYKTPFEIFEEEAIANKLIATNEHAEKPKEKISTFVNSGSVEPKNDYANRVFFGAPKQ